MQGQGVYMGNVTIEHARSHIIVSLARGLARVEALGPDVLSTMAKTYGESAYRQAPVTYEGEAQAWADSRTDTNESQWAAARVANTQEEGGRKSDQSASPWNDAITRAQPEAAKMEPGRPERTRESWDLAEVTQPQRKSANSPVSQPDAAAMRNRRASDAIKAEAPPTPLAETKMPEAPRPISYDLRVTGRDGNNDIQSVQLVPNYQVTH